MSLNDTIGTFNTGSYTVTRIAGSSYGSDGRVVEGSSSTITISGVVQPANGRDLLVAAEAQVTSEVRKLYTVTELKQRSPTTDPDIVTIDGDPWTVFNVSRYDGIANTYYKVLVARRLMT